MEQNTLARFTVTVTSVEHASWQGVVETDEKKFAFRSELQLLRFILEQYPALQPDVSRKCAEPT